MYEVRKPTPVSGLLRALENAGAQTPEAGGPGWGGMGMEGGVKSEEPPEQLGWPSPPL